MDDLPLASIISDPDTQGPRGHKLFVRLKPGSKAERGDQRSARGIVDFDKPLRLRASRLPVRRILSHSLLRNRQVVVTSIDARGVERAHVVYPYQLENIGA
jgi:hypothetical protein